MIYYKIFLYVTIILILRTNFKISTTQSIKTIVRWTGSGI